MRVYFVATLVAIVVAIVVAIAAATAATAAMLPSRARRFLKLSGRPSRVETCIIDPCIIIAVASDENEFLDNFRDSIARVGLSVHVLGLKEPWKGFLQKIVAINNFVKDLDPKQSICYCDAYDVLFCKKLPPPVHDKIVISGESNTMGGHLSAPLHNVWKANGDDHNKYLNAGFVYGSAGDIHDMLRWCITKERDIKFSGTTVYDNSSNVKAHNRGASWIPMQSNEFDNVAKDPLVHGLDQVLLCMFANEFPHKIQLDMDEHYVTSIMEDENFNVETLTTQYGSPCVIHIPFMKRRMNLYTRIKDRVLLNHGQ
jgi:hypothetical protein